KKVRTVTIRPDQAGSDSSTQSGIVPSTRSIATTTVQPTTTAPITTQVTTTQSTTGPITTGTTTPSRSVGATAKPGRTQGQGTEASDSATTAPGRTASIAPVTNARSTSTANLPEGSFMVQVSSQKSEGEAQSSYRAMQAKY